MPSWSELGVLAVLAGVVALVVTLLMHMIGLGQHAVVAAACSASAAAAAASVVTRQHRAAGEMDAAWDDQG